MRSASYQLCGLRVPFIVCLFVFAYVAQPVQSSGSPYYGKLISKLSELHHGVSGTVYAVDSRTIHIKDFTYDGQGPAAYFYVGNSKTPSNNGIRVRDERGSSDVLKRYRKKSITLTLPEGRTLSNIKWFSVWCDEFSVNFGDVKIPSKFDFPKPQKVDALNGVHSITSDNIVIVDAQTLLVPNLSFDGEAPDAKFWVGVGPKPSPQGTLVPDENGKVTPLRRYDRKTVVLTLPGDLTVFDIGHFGIWCEAFTVDFGHIKIPSNLNVPPSLKMLGVSPQKRARAVSFASPPENLPEPVSNQQQYQNDQQIDVTTYRPQLSFRPQLLQTPTYQQQRSYEIQQSLPQQVIYQPPQYSQYVQQPQPFQQYQQYQQPAYLQQYQFQPSLNYPQQFQPYNQQIYQQFQ